MRFLTAFFFSSSPLASGAKSPIGSLRPVKRTSPELYAEQPDRPSWGSMGNLPLFGHHPAMSEDDIHGPGAMSQEPSQIVPTLSMLGASGVGNTGVGGANVGSRSVSAQSSPRAPLSPNSAATRISGPTMVSTLSPTLVQVPTEFDFKQRLAMQVGVQPATSGQQHSPVHMRPPLAGGSSPAPMMKPAPLQRAGSAGGVLMHAPRRPPPSNVASALSTQPNAAEHPSWPGSGPMNSNSAYRMGYDEGSEEWFDQFGGIEMEPTGGMGSVGQNHMSLSGVMGTVSSPSPAQTHNVGVLPSSSAFLQHASYSSPSYDSLPEYQLDSGLDGRMDGRLDTRLEMGSIGGRANIMGTRYMPNQRAHFGVGSPLHNAGFPLDSLANSGLVATPVAPTYLQHAGIAPSTATGLGMGVSPQSSSPGGVFLSSPLNGVSGSYSTIKHSSRILMIHNLDALGADVGALRTLFSSHGPIRSVSSYPESNALLISYFDLRHAQKAMASINAKQLPNGALLELQYHFLRDTGVMSKESNQGTLVIFNLDPSITNSELTELFGKHGEIKEIRESPNRKHKFVEFYDVRCAEKAIKVLNKTDLHGRKIKIEPSRPGGANKLETAQANGSNNAGRRGSLGSTMFGNAPIYTPSPSLSSAFTHSTPTLPTMSPGYHPTANGYTSFSPNAAPLLAHPGSSPYHSHNISPRYAESMTEDPNMFSSHPAPESPFGMVPMSAAPGLSLGQSPSTLGSPYADRQMPMSPDLQLKFGDRESTLFDRATMDAPLLSPHASYAREVVATAGYIESSTTAQLFGDMSISHIGAQNDVLQSLHPVSEGLQGLLLSPNITPRSNSTSPSSSSSDSGGLGVPSNSIRDDDSMSLLPVPGVSNGSGGDSSSSMPLRFDILIPQVLGGADIRTTLMIKNIPNKYDQDMLLLAVNKHHQGTYDFFYLPIDFKNRCNVGYAFINFIDPKSIPAFYEEFNNKKWEKFNSEKVCRISYARIQGKISMIEHFKNSSLMFEDPKCRPLIFHSDGSSIGKPEPFPVGPNVRPRARKDSSGSASSSASPAFASSTSSSTSSSTGIASPIRVHKSRKDKSTSATSSHRAQPEH